MSISKSVLALIGFAAVSLPMVFSASAEARPYVLSKTEVNSVGTKYDSTQTEVRAGYEQSVGKSAKVYVELGPGYQWPSGDSGQALLVYEIGVKGDITKNLEGKIKVEGGYGFTTQTTQNKVETTIQYNF